jgi:hypothetical protein
MFIECRHILPTGYKCKSPALRGQFFCYFHNMSRRLQRGSKKHVKQSSFPSVEDSGGVKMALNKVFRDLDAGRIDPRRAGLFFYGLQLASKLALRPGGNPLDTVREVCEAEDGTGILGPEKSACEPPADCINCSRRGFCETSRSINVRWKNSKLSCTLNRKPSNQKPENNLKRKSKHE